MFRTTLFSAAAALCLAAPLAQAQSQADIDRFIAAVAQQGCQITGANGDAIKAATGFTDAQLTSIIVALAQAGALAVNADQSVMTVRAGACAS